MIDDFDDDLIQRLERRAGAHRMHNPAFAAAIAHSGSAEKGPRVYRARHTRLDEASTMLTRQVASGLNPLLQLNPHYKAGGSVLDLVGDGTLDPGCAEYFRDLQSGERDADRS